MASCITKQWSNSNTPQVQLTVTQTGSTNTTATLSWSLIYVPHGTAAYYGSPRPYTVTIDGTKVKSGSFTIDGKTSQSTIASGKITVSKSSSSRNVSFSVSFSFNITWSGVYGGTMTASSSIGIAAKISTYTITYNANGGSGAPPSGTKQSGSNYTISTTKPTRSGYTFQGWGLSSSTSTVSYKSGSTYSKNSNLALYAVWKANTYTITYNANGGSGAPPSGTKTYNVTYTLSTTKPTRAGYTFQGWNTNKNATTANYAPGGKYTSNASVTLYAIWKNNYTKPQITSYSVCRCDADGKVNEIGACILAHIRWSTFNKVTSIKFTILYGTTTVSTHSLTPASDKSGDQTITIGSDLDSNKTYKVMATVTDSGGTTSITRPVSAYQFTLDLLSGGKGIAFGKAAETEGYADFGFKSKFRKDLEFEQYTAIYGTDANGRIYEAFYPRNSNGNLVIGYGNYDAKSGDTNIYGTSVNIAVSETPNPTSFKPYVCKGDTLDFEIATAGYITNNFTNICFFVPCSRYILGSPTVSAISVDGLMIRQAGKYTHGSSATKYVKPSSYSVSATQGGFNIVATISTTTNAVNNDACGVRWSGKIVLS